MPHPIAVFRIFNTSHRKIVGAELMVVWFTRQCYLHEISADQLARPINVFDIMAGLNVSASLRFLRPIPLSRSGSET
jgi:hypothetical protein